MARDTTRPIAVKVLSQLLQQHGSLTTLLDKFNQQESIEKKALVQALCYGLCRHYEQLIFIAGLFLQRPLRKKDQDVYCLLLIGIYQLFFMRMPDYAVINECVAACGQLNKLWAKKLVNAVLRSVQREAESLKFQIDASINTKYSHPSWLVDALQHDWPEHYLEILSANNNQAPMTLRVNISKTSVKHYQNSLDELQVDAKPGSLVNTSLILNEAIAVDHLPGFQQGLVSIQDEASQLAAALLDPQAEDTILDACAAPGGKSCAILERAPGAALFAVDNDAVRLKRVEENLQRIGATANLVLNDILQQAKNWQQTQQFFDRILLDVPCSATGVIRRHPDIKLLRRPEDIKRLQLLQAEILKQVWPLLKPKGVLLYSTCSVLKAENSDQIANFIEHTEDVIELVLPEGLGLHCEHGRQLFPRTGSHDGFYYALLQKC